MSNNEQTAVADLSFEQAYELLQDTVQKLEAGNLPLNQALELYQQGMALAKQCALQLDNAELSIKSLTPSGDLIDLDEV